MVWEVHSFWQWNVRQYKEMLVEAARRNHAQKLHSTGVLDKPNENRVTKRGKLITCLHKCAPFYLTIKGPEFRYIFTAFWILQRLNNLSPELGFIES